MPWACGALARRFVVIYGFTMLVTLVFMALLPVGANTVFPTLGAARSLWHLSVLEADVAHVQHYLRTERDY